MTIRAAHAGNRPAPIFTIVVPTYNSDAYAARCLDSLRHQGLREGEAEVRMVDDGSHPDFFSRLGRLCEGRDDVILDRQDRNAGPGAARNRAMSAARGDWIVFLDSDDEFAPGSLRRLADHIAGLPDDLDVVAYDWEGVCDQPGAGPEQRSGRRDAEFLTHRDTRIERYLSLHMESSIIFAVRRSLVEAHGLRFAGGLHEDVAFLFKAYYLARRVSYLEQKLYLRHYAGGSIVHSATPAHLQGYFGAWDEIERFLNTHEPDPARLARYRACLAKARAGAAATRVRDAIRHAASDRDVHDLLGRIATYVLQCGADENFQAFLASGATLYARIARMVQAAAEDGALTASACGALVDDVRALEGKSWSSQALHHGLCVDRDCIRNGPAALHPAMADAVGEGSGALRFDLVLAVKQSLHQKLNAGLPNPYEGHPELGFRKWGPLNDLSIRCLWLHRDSRFDIASILESAWRSGVVTPGCRIEWFGEAGETDWEARLGASLLTRFTSAA